MTKSLTIEVPCNVREDDVHGMVAALASFRGDQWWFHEENSVGGGRSLAPLVLQNMMLQLQAGTLEPSMRKFRNILESAIFYEARARDLQSKIESVEGYFQGCAKPSS